MDETASLSLPVMMLVVFAAAKLLAELFERLGQPGLLGEILAGVLIGPSVLHLVGPDARMETLAELGVIFLLFRVGLEVNPEELWAVRGTAMIVATIGVLVPLGAGYFFMRWWGAASPAAIFVGAAMVATSVGVTAQALSARGLLSQRASRIILAAAVIDDVLGLIVLAVVAGIAKGKVNVVDIVVTAALACAFTVVMARWGSHAFRRAVPALHSKLRAGESQFNIAMVSLFALAALAAWTGVAAIVGAFLAGLALSQTATERVRDLASGVNELFVPFFLAGIGLHIDLGVLSDRSSITLVAAIFAIAVLTKLVGCGLGAIGLGWREVLKIGFGMVPRGEVGMVVAQFGLAAGVLSARTYGAVVFMAMLTTVATPVLLRFVFEQPSDDSGGGLAPEPDFDSQAA